MRTIAKAVVENPPLKVLIDQASIGHNGGPAIDDETSGVMTVPEFCIWARVIIGTQIDFLVLDGSPEALDKNVVSPCALAVHAATPDKRSLGR